MKKKKVIVGMSGGVDSSVAAFLLKKQGYQVEGLFMKNWEEDDKNGCSIINDLKDAQLVCDKIGIKLNKINFSAEYWNNVFKFFLKEYKLGRTPNPDILCNKEIKFKLFLEYAKKDLHADFIATGHHARNKKINGLNCLLKGIDKNKDQSYFLYTINSNQLSQILFPIGNLEKLKVRNIARNLKFSTADKKDSTGICFIGKRKFNKFLNRYLPLNPGKIKTINGEILKDHIGLMYYTIGQRKGLKIGGLKNANNDPWYVVDKDILHNCLIVAQGKNHISLMSIGCIVKNLNWVNHLSIKNSLRCNVKVRYHQHDDLCNIFLLQKNTLKVIFDEPIRAITPGQSAVFYLGEICLGGGIIDKRLSYK